MTTDKLVNDLKSISILGEFSEFSNKIHRAKNPMEAAEMAYDCITSLTSADLLLIHQKKKGEEANLLFIRTLNDSTITGRVMKQEREIALHLMENHLSSKKTTLTATPPLFYGGTACDFGGNACCLSMMRVSAEFSDQEIQIAYVILNLFMSSLLNQIIEDKSQRIGTQELQTQRQNNFINNITHDLRNPLGCIKGYSSTLLREDIEWDEETRKKFLTIIDNEADRLGDMITNMLETANLESGQYDLNFDQVAVSALLNTLLEGNRVRHPTLNIHVEQSHPDALIMVDTQKVVRAFQNLIDNTVKHANTLEIWIKIIQNKNTIDIYFVDRGKGIPHSRWKTIFNKFSRIPDDSPGTHGSGLGLFITKQIITKHGGTIEIDESTEEGTMIRITLPKIPSKISAA